MSTLHLGRMEGRERERVPFAMKGVRWMFARPTNTNSLTHPSLHFYTHWACIQVSEWVSEGDRLNGMIGLSLNAREFAIMQTVYRAPE